MSDVVDRTRLPCPGSRATEAARGGALLVFDYATGVIEAPTSSTPLPR